jgi:dienelactone hydrolase
MQGRTRFALTVALLVFASFSQLQAGDFLPSVDDTLTIKHWLAVGPFSTGTREGYIDHLVDQGGEEGIQPAEGLEHPSIMAQEGTVSWKRVEAEDGVLKIGFKDVDWDALQAHHGWAGTGGTGYAYAQINVEGPKRALILTEKVGSFWLNGWRYYGDVYGIRRGKVRVLVPVVLEDGANRILLKFSVGGEHKTVIFKILPGEDPVAFNLLDLTVPDAIDGEVLNRWMAIPLINTTDQAFKGVVLKAGGDGIFKQTEITLPFMAPLTIEKVPLRLETKEKVTTTEDTLFVSVMVEAAGKQISAPIPLRVRHRGQGFRTTYRSRADSSVQEFTVVPPESFSPDSTYGLILFLHGASISSGRVDGYYTPKSWAFVVGPTNRRPYGFDWQDWGRIDVLEVLNQMKKRYQIDPDRIHLTGHSMGGHGTWHVGLHHADLFAVIAPSAGWTSFNLYVPFFMRRSYIYAPPKLRSIRDMALREDRAEVFLENALNLPAFILHGGEDDEVPPVHAKIMFRGLRRLGYDVTYREVPGKKHWWNQEGVEGNACVNYPELIDFLRGKVRNPAPRKVVFKTTDLGLNNRMYWVQIEQLTSLYRDASVVAEVMSAHELDLKISNVAQFTIFPPKGLLELGTLHLTVNNQRLSTRLKDFSSLTFSQTRKGRFVLRTPRHKGLWKKPGLYGPIKEAYFSPFIFVYGTAGSPEETEVNLHIARNKAQKWWYRGNGWVRIIPDTSMTKQITKNYNLILFGGPGSNLVSRRINPRLPISIHGQRVKFGNKKLSQSQLALKIVYPNPFNPEKLVVVNAGTDPEGMKLVEVLDTLHSSAGLPDYIIYGGDIKTQGWGGVIAAGFFGSDWKLDPSLGFAVLQ